MASRSERFQDDLLIALVKTSSGVNDGYLDPKEVANQAGLQYPPGLIFEAVTDLEARGYVNMFPSIHSGGPDDGLKVGITSVGWDAAEEIEKKRQEVGQEVESEAEKLIRIDRDSTEYIEALKKLNETIETIRSANDYTLYSDDKDKSQRVSELNAGYALLQADRVRLEAVKSVLFRALRYLAKKFADHAIGAVARTALKALSTLLGV